MKNSKVLPILLLCLSFVTASLTLMSPGLAEADEPHFLCTVRLIAADLEGGYGEKAFKAAPVASGGHGGETQVFEFGEHVIHVISDWRWLGLAWFQGEKKIAHSVNVVTGANEHRVLILFHPDADEDQVSIDCSVVL